MVSCLICKSLSHFEFTFVCGVRECLNFILLPVAVQFQAPLLPLNLTGTSRVLVDLALCQALLGSSSPGGLEVPAHSLFQGRREGTAPDPAQEGAACQNGPEWGGGCGCWRLGAPLRCKTQLSDAGSAWLETARLRGEGLGSGGRSCRGRRTAGCGQLALAPTGTWRVSLDSGGERKSL